jgi:hypothetical protein
VAETLHGCSRFVIYGLHNAGAHRDDPGRERKRSAHQGGWS